MLFWYIAETLPPNTEASLSQKTKEENGAYQKPPKFPPGMTLVERMNIDEGRDPLRHENTGVDEEEALYESHLLSVEDAREKLRGTIMADVVRLGWEAICALFGTYTKFYDDGPWKSLQGYANLSIQLVSSGPTMIMPGWISRSSPMLESHHQPSHFVWKNVDVCWPMSDDGQMSNTTCPINDAGPSQSSYTFHDKIPQVDEAKNTGNTEEQLLAASFLLLVMVALILWRRYRQSLKAQAQTDRLVNEIEVLHERALAGIDLDHVTDAMDPLDSLLDLRQTALRRIDSLMLSARMGIITENDNLSSENNGLIDDLRAQADYLEHIEKSLTYQTEELAIEKTDLEADNKGLADQNGELTAQIADLEADKKGLFDLVEDIMTQCDKLDATIQSLQARNGGLVKENRDLKAIREKLQEEVKASKSREVANAKAKTQHAGDIKRLEEEVSRLNSRLKDDQIRHGQEILDKIARRIRGKAQREYHDQDQDQIVEANKCLELENVELKTKISCAEKRVEDLEGQLEGAETDRAQLEDSHVEVEAKLKGQETYINKLLAEIEALDRKAIDEAEARDEKHHEEKGQIRKQEEAKFNEIASKMQEEFEAKARQQKEESDQVIAQIRKDQQESEALSRTNAEKILPLQNNVLSLTETLQARNRLLATVGLGSLAGAPINASNLPNEGPHGGALPPQHSSASAMYPHGHRFPVPQGQHFPRAFPVNRGQGPYAGVTAWARQEEDPDDRVVGRTETANGQFGMNETAIQLTTTRPAAFVPGLVVTASRFIIGVLEKRITRLEILADSSAENALQPTQQCNSPGLDQVGPTEYDMAKLNIDVEKKLEEIDFDVCRTRSNKHTIRLRASLPPTESFPSKTPKASMNERASPEHSRVTTSATSNPEVNNLQTIHNMHSFTSALQSAFGDPDKQTTSRNQLEACRQKEPSLPRVHDGIQKLCTLDRLSGEACSLLRRSVYNIVPSTVFVYIVTETTAQLDFVPTTQPTADIPFTSIHQRFFHDRQTAIEVARHRLSTSGPATGWLMPPTTMKLEGACEQRILYDGDG
ncbi:MAG: hypothetical protein LQ350_002307 [Teloschistes chrysophthalmus]|nr:MAG: hypothetical protein LQ350_002307 [Niorma chrysophthalma]